MKLNQRGFAVIELIVAVAIGAIITGATAVTTFQVSRNGEQARQRMTATQQVQTAGYWLTADAQMAQSVLVDVTAPNLVVFSYVERDYFADSVLNIITYTFVNLDDGIGTLRRTHWSSTGLNQQTYVGRSLYFEPGDPQKSTKVSYTKPVLTLQLTAIAEEATETRQYILQSRPKF